MVIVNLNMGNFTLEVNNLKIDWLWGKRRRKCYKRNWIKREISRRGISIMWKFGRIIGQNLSQKKKVH